MMTYDDYRMGIRWHIYHGTFLSQRRNMSCRGKLKTSEAKVQELNKANEANLAAAAAKASAESAAKTTDEPRCFLKAVL